MSSRSLVISEEFGLYRVRTSGGTSVAGPKLGAALFAATKASGIDTHLAEDIWENAATVFELLCPKRDERPDVPLST